MPGPGYKEVLTSLHRILPAVAGNSGTLLPLARSIHSKRTWYALRSMLGREKILQIPVRVVVYHFLFYEGRVSDNSTHVKGLLHRDQQGLFIIEF